MTLLATVVDTSRRVATTSARSAKIRLLADGLRALDAQELEIAVLYLSGEVRQARLGIGPSTLRACLAGNAPGSSIHLLDVDALLDKLATIRGTGSNAERAALLREFFGRATAEEQEFLVRLLAGGLRQGALQGVMVEAIAAATDTPLPEVRRAAMYESNLGALARVARQSGAAGLAGFQLRVMSPISPMLAQVADDVDEALESLGGNAAFEWKMDGARIQLHKQNDLVRIFTRNLNDVTAAIPEIAAAARSLPTKQLVLDGEAIAFTQAGRPHAFQTTMRRFGRKLDVAAMQQELPMRAYYFDCLRYDELSTAELPARERFASLAEVLPTAQVIPRLVTDSSEAAQRFYDAALAAGHEGLMAKSLDAPYEAGNRGASWLKIKRAHTLDLVVLAAEWGHGRRQGKLSNLHLGALDVARQRYVMLGKTFKGMTDEMLEWQTREFLARESHHDQWTVYVRPEIVVEIAFSDLQASSRYPGGLALRLARVKRYRPDKRAEDADTLETVRKIFAMQAGTAG
ncbi:MAG TPA: ATP-dependent DNA ligase [Steroidobacteraceae bacterium]|jgi:DNA ligase-1|nr:ATP-dependent DNA ligase [Steroidobacteraceae bacterium]